MEHTAKGLTFQQLYMWYVQDEFGQDMWEQELKTKPMPPDKVIQNVAMSPDEYPFSEENEVVMKRMPQMAFNPFFVSPGSKPNEQPTLSFLD